MKLQMFRELDGKRNENKIMKHFVWIIVMRLLTWL